MSKSILALVCAILVGAGVFASSRLHGADPKPATQPAPVPATQPAVDPKPVNNKCLVTGEDVDPKITVVYESKTYAFCCDDCVKAFNKNPEKYVNGK